MKCKCLDCGACLFLPPCKELGRDWRVSEEDWQQCACSLFQVQNLDSILAELMEKERDAWCQIVSFIYLICETLEFPWPWSSFCLTRGVLVGSVRKWTWSPFHVHFHSRISFPFLCYRISKNSYADNARSGKIPQQGSDPVAALRTIKDMAVSHPVPSLAALASRASWLSCVMAKQAPFYSRSCRLPEWVNPTPPRGSQ